MNNGARMTDQESRDLIKLIESATREHTATPEKAKQFLIEAGIITETGELAPPYRSE